MLIFLPFLLTGVLGYFLWRHKTSNLTRNCRWRQDRRVDEWRCAFCGGKEAGPDSPRDCRQMSQSK